MSEWSHDKVIDFSLPRSRQVERNMGLLYHLVDNLLWKTTVVTAYACG